MPAQTLSTTIEEEETMAKKKKTVQTSPIDDLTYDVITILHEKTKGLEAYEKYIDDASDDEELLQLLETSRDNDRECVEQLQEHLARLLGQNVEVSGESDEIEDDSEEDDSEEDTQSRGRSKKSA
jgi:hypothetical protein